MREHSPDETFTAKGRMDDNDDVQSFKSTKSRSNRPSGKNKILSLKLFNQNAVKAKSDIDHMVSADENIDVEKIRKTFKNLIND